MWLYWKKHWRLHKRKLGIYAAVYGRWSDHDWRPGENCRNYADRSLSHTHLGIYRHTNTHSGSFPLLPLCVKMKVVDVEREQKAREVAGLQTRLSLEEQKEEERVKELFTIKQKLTEAEAARNSLKKEVRRESHQKSKQQQEGILHSIICFIS